MTTKDTILGRIVWYELLTTDMKAAEEFYTRVVGWGAAPFDSVGHPYTVWLRPDGGRVGGVMNLPDGMNFPPHWEMYIGVPNLDDAVAAIEKGGGQSLSPVIEVPMVGRVRTMKDPQGAVFAIHEALSAEVPPESEPRIGDGSWHELFTTDPEAAMTFYTEAFGWRPTESMDMGEMGKYHMFGRTMPLGGMMNKVAAMAHVPPHWSMYFRVDNVHAGAERVQANGGQILNGPMEVPGGDWIVNCMDPQGAAFSLHHR